MSRANDTTIIKADKFDSYGRLVCKCREPASRFVSRQKQSEGRAFWKCGRPQYERDKHCDFWSWEDVLSPPVDENGYRADPGVGTGLAPPPESPARSGMSRAGPSRIRSDSNAEDPNVSFSRSKPTPSRSRFMQAKSSPESTKAAVETWAEIMRKTEEKLAEDAAAYSAGNLGAAFGGSVGASSSSSTEALTQSGNGRSDGGFRPRPTTPITRPSNQSGHNHSSNGIDSPMEIDPKDVEMVLKAPKDSGAFTRTNVPTTPKRQGLQDRVTVTDEGSPRKRARGSGSSVHFESDDRLDEPFSLYSPTKPAFPEYVKADAAAAPQSSATQVEDILGLNPQTPTKTPSRAPPTPSRTPSSTVSTTEVHNANLLLMNDQILGVVAHMQLLQRRLTASELSCEAKMNRIKALEEQNRALEDEVKRLKMEKDDLQAKFHRSDNDNIDLRRQLKGKGKSTI